MRESVIDRCGYGPCPSALGVIPKLAEFLRAAASFGDLCSPQDGGFARRELQDTEAAVELLRLGIGFVCYRAVRGDHEWCDILVDTTTNRLHACSLRLAHDLVRSFAHGGKVLGGNFHRPSRKGNKVFRHRSVLRLRSVLFARPNGSALVSWSALLGGAYALQKGAADQLEPS